MAVIVIIIVALLVFLIAKPYFIQYDNLVSFTGGLGSGKTFMSVNTALTLYRKQRIKAIIHNLFNKEKVELPELYSNIPLKINARKYAIRLTKEHLLLQKKIAPGSVCMLDEVDVFANQFQYNNPCIVNAKGGEDNGNFDEFCRFYRHYTKGGYLIFNSQATANENLTIRRRQNTVFQLFNFKKWGIPLLPPLFYTVKARHITLSDETKAVEENNTEDNMRTIFGIMPFIRHYDTYCYSGRYDTVPKGEEHRFSRLKTNECLIAPHGAEKKFTTNKDIPIDNP